MDLIRALRYGILSYDRYLAIKDCEKGAGRTPLVCKRKYFAAFLKGMAGALDNPFLETG